MIGFGWHLTFKYHIPLFKIVWCNGWRLTLKAFFKLLISPKWGFGLQDTDALWGRLVMGWWTVVWAREGGKPTFTWPNSYYLSTLQIISPGGCGWLFGRTFWIWYNLNVTAAILQHICRQTPKRRQAFICATRTVHFSLFDWKFYISVNERKKVEKMNWLFQCI